jgi:hypothetical protein
MKREEFMFLCKAECQMKVKTLLDIHGLLQNMEQLAKKVGQIETKMESLVTEAVLQSSLQTKTSVKVMGMVDSAMKDFTKELGIMKTAIHTNSQRKRNENCRKKPQLPRNWPQGKMALHTPK